MVVLSNSPGNQAVHLQLTWPMLAADLFPGWSPVQDRFGSPVARTDPTRGVEGRVDRDIAYHVGIGTRANFQPKQTPNSLYER